MQGEEDKTDSSSFSSVTTLTEAPSQQSFEALDTNHQKQDGGGGIETKQQSRSKVDSLFSRKLDELIKAVGHKDAPLDTRELLQQCELLKTLYSQYDERYKGDPSNSYLDMEKLKDLAARYSTLLSAVDQKSRTMSILVNANNELNQYISDMEDYHSKELGKLKAEMSLTRIENEVGTKALTIAESSPIKNVTPKKRRRSSLLFWKRKSQSASNLVQPAESAVIADSTSRLQEELLQKAVLIEELRKLCNDYEQKEKILETANHDKSIELMIKANRLQELNKELKLHMQDKEHCYEMLRDFENTVVVTNNQLDVTRTEIGECRSTTQQNHEKVQKLEWILKRLNEENKLLLTKINTKNYEMGCEKLKTEEVVREVKKYLLSLIDMTYQERAEEKGEQNESGESFTENDNVIKSLMRILRENVSTICHAPQDTEEISAVVPTEERSSQTDYVPSSSTATVIELKRTNTNTLNEMNDCIAKVNAQTACQPLTPSLELVCTTSKTLDRMDYNIAKANAKTSCENFSVESLERIKKTDEKIDAQTSCSENYSIERDAQTSFGGNHPSERIRSAGRKVDAQTSCEDDYSLENAISAAKIDAQTSCEDGDSIERLRKLPSINANTSFNLDFPKEDRDSGLSISEESFPAFHHQLQVRRHGNSVHNGPQRQQQQQQRPAKQYKKTFGENKEFRKDLLGYVEYMKNREIAGYKEDLRSLERENYELKSSLDVSNQKLQNLKVEFDYRKSVRHKVPLTSTPDRQPINIDYSLGNRPRGGERRSMEKPISTYNNNHSKSPPRQASTRHSDSQKTRRDTREPFIESNVRTNDHELFIQSFEKGDALIRGIFKEKDKLQRQLVLSRQQVRHKRNVENIRVLS